MEAESWYKSDHHRNRVALWIGQDLTASKSVYYHSIRKNIENQSEGDPLQWKVWKKENWQTSSPNPKGRHWTQKASKFQLLDREVSTDLSSNKISLWQYSFSIVNTFLFLISFFFSYFSWTKMGPGVELIPHRLRDSLWSALSLPPTCLVAEACYPWGTQQARELGDNVPPKPTFSRPQPVTHRRWYINTPNPKPPFDEIALRNTFYWLPTFS